MKARVRATGEIVEVAKDGPFYNVIDGYERYYEHELDFQDALAYWEKLKHQYAGMAMQGILSNNNLLTALCDGNKEVPISKIVLNSADIIATALVNRFKKEEK